MTGIQATKQYEIRTSKSTLDYYRIGLLVYCKFKYTSFSKLHGISNCDVQGDRDVVWTLQLAGEGRTPIRDEPDS